MTDMSGDEIIELLGGTNAVADLVGVKPPSVSEWRKTGIPESRLIELAATIERKAPDRFSRRTQWPTRYAAIWPELASDVPPSGAPASDLAEPSQQHLGFQDRRRSDAVNPFPDLDRRRPAGAV
jgi:DNA-binding transcriptional regulator YdaS (Cro superfamily)